jgi:hypothetical protein
MSTLPLFLFGKYTFNSYVNLFFYNICAYKNLINIFGYINIPSVSTIRNNLDNLHPSHLTNVLSSMCNDVLNSLFINNENPYKEGYNYSTLVPFDGTQTHSSYNISSDLSNTRRHKTNDGEKTEFFEYTVCSAIVSPSAKKAMIFDAEFVTSLFGGTKQDCESKTFRRELPRTASNIHNNNNIILGDNLFCKNDIILTIDDLKNFHYIITCKEKSNIGLFSNIYGIKLKTKSKFAPLYGR